MPRTTRKRASLYDPLRLGHELGYVSLGHSVFGDEDPDRIWHRLDPARPGLTVCDIMIAPWADVFMRDLGLGAHRCPTCMPPEAA